MKLHMKLALAIAALALGVFPSMALAGVDYGPEYQPEPPTHPTHPVHATAPKCNAYGDYCKGESKKHVKGEKGTAFSRCVRDVNRMRRDARASVLASAQV
jgi:hypothetical protein